MHNFFLFRFKSPVPAKLWNGVRMANADGNECPQMRGTEIVGSEDCLYLNVFTPSEILRSSKVNSYFIPTGNNCYHLNKTRESSIKFK